jgi:glycyl-tRNA synthetase
MLEMECTCLTPAIVLKTSGHVDRFTDLMVKDVSTGDCFRADKLLEDAIDQFLANNASSLSSDAQQEHLRIQRQADAFSPTELDELLLKYNVKSTSGEPFSNSFPFNLMFVRSQLFIFSCCQGFFLFFLASLFTLLPSASHCMIGIYSRKQVLVLKELR